MSGLQGGGTSPSCGNGRVSGGSAGTEHRYSFPSVDCAKWDNAPVGVVDTDSRFSGEKGPVLGYPNTMGQPRGKMMGPMGGQVSSSDFCGHGQGGTRANTVAAQSINDAESTTQGFPK